MIEWFLPLTRIFSENPTSPRRREVSAAANRKVAKLLRNLGLSVISRPLPRDAL